MGLSDDTVASVLAHYAPPGEAVAVTRLPGGHINDTYRVEVRGSEGRATYLLQCLNSHVFSNPVQVMENVARVTRHVRARMGTGDLPNGHPGVPALVPTREGGDWHATPDGTVWRMFPFVQHAVVHERADSPRDAYAAGRAFGAFLRLLADYDGPPLHETIVGFHDTTSRFTRLEAAVHADSHGRVSGTRGEIDVLMSARSAADLLPPLVASGAVPVRIVHNDAKLANVLLHETTGEPLYVVDLDTVMPGLALYDFGDLVRSVTSPTAEDEEDVSRIGVQIPIFEALARGYLEAAGGVLLAREHELLGFSGRLITLEQAVRFLTDHLEGDRYYRIERAGQNLARCRAQLALWRSLTQHADRLDDVIRSLKASARIA